MEFEVSYSLDNEQQFWDELDEIVSAHCQSHELIDNALRSYLSFTTNYRGEYLQSEYDVARCSYKLLESSLFSAHKDYVRRQIIYGLLQEDTPDTLLLITSFLLADGRQHEATFEMMNEEGAFPRLLELIQGMKDGDIGLHRMLLELLYEMSRIQRIRTGDLIQIEDEFIIHLLQIIEGLSYDVNDPYHYHVIRVLLVLNEQYMVSAHDPGPDQFRKAPLPNKIIQILSHDGPIYKTFGENIILLLNRESKNPLSFIHDSSKPPSEPPSLTLDETSLQLLILKLLYLLFTTPPTYEYFYTNDLRVLVDVMIRNLLDLPLTATALRHTYLRVLYPLLAHTQLRLPECHYKREELLRLLAVMASNGGVGMLHFGAVDETTTRLVERCLRVAWLRETEGPGDGEAGDRLTAEKRPKKKGAIGGNAKAGESSLSVLEVAAHKEKPGVQTPSLRLGKKGRDQDQDTDGGGGGGGGGVIKDDSVGNGVVIHADADVDADAHDPDLSVLTSPFEVEEGGEL
ncbi:MAG: hypothetical protein Q9187_004842 [Circinaria calcarea]